jgi:DNA polymerase III delta prime subunit
MIKTTKYICITNIIIVYLHMYAYNTYSDPLYTQNALKHKISIESGNKSDNTFKYQNKIKKKLDFYVENNNVPNILFSGNHNSGKLHLMHYLLDKIYENVENKFEYVLFVNCAFGKGIQFIRNELKFFARTHNTKYENNRFIFKSIVLLNAEKLTMDAQSALRRCIEIFSNSTRFFIITNNKMQILCPIVSRFTEIFVYRPCKHKLKLPKSKFEYLEKMLLNLYNNDEELQIALELYENGVTTIDLLYLFEKMLKDDYYKYNFLHFVDTQRHYINNEQMALVTTLCEYKMRFIV